MNWSLIHEPGANGKSLARRSKKQFKNKLQQIVQNPRIESARLSDLPDCYKIKLRRQVIGWCIKYEIVWWWFTLLPLAKERKRPFIIRRINGSIRYRK